MSSTATRLISVVGATGNQGGGVVELLLQSTDYNVRAISSNPSSDKAKALLQRHSKFVDAKRFEVVEGNLNDRASLEKAIEGSYGVFASFSPTPSDGPIEENPEVVQGKNLVDALKVSNSILPTYFMSSLTHFCDTGCRHRTLRLQHSSKRRRAHSRPHHWSVPL